MVFSDGCMGWCTGYYLRLDTKAWFISCNVIINHAIEETAEIYVGL